MPNINLIAQKRNEKARLERAVRRLFFLMSGLLITAIVLFIVLSAQWFRIKGEINSMDEELARLQPTVDKITKFRALTRDLQPKIQLYGQSREHTLRWYTYLQVVARSMPENTWLTRIYSENKGTMRAGQDTSAIPNAVVNLSGIAMNQELVAETMMQLNQYSGTLSGVDLHFTRKGQVERVPVVEFEVATNIKDLPAFFNDQASAPGKDSTGGKDVKNAKS